MGSEKVYLPTKKQLQLFLVDLLKDVRALENMLENDLFESDPIRIGAEQEMCLVDQDWRPAMVNTEVLAKANNKLFTTELARFNLEANVKPLIFKGKCLSKMEESISSSVEELRKSANELGADILLTGILPTVKKIDLNIEKCLTPLERYRALCDGLSKMRGTGYLELSIRGIDELLAKHDTPLIEGCNTGFQVHLQVKPSEFAQKYNIAQAIAGPALAVATNSPLLFGKRLWHETRIALFQQSVDIRTSGDHLRHRNARVMFGNNWVSNSILEIYKEDIMRFRVLLGSTLQEDSLEALANGKMPELYALLIHNSTVYRWNRPCYGIAKGKPHLRIENRVLPSGPTVKDEIANATLWLGLLNGLNDHYPNLTEKMSFADAKANFEIACRNGMNTKFLWMGNETATPSSELLVKELIPIAREGLLKAKVDKKDIDHYLGIIEERAKLGRTGSHWMLQSYGELTKNGAIAPEEAITIITASMSKQQKTNTPVHQWRLADLKKDLGDWQPSAFVVEEFMQTDLFTVHPEDIIELAARIMDWKSLKYVPVEDNEGRLAGLLTARILFKHFLDNYYEQQSERAPTVVVDLMIKNPITIEPGKSITDAIELMQKHQIGCLPVVKNQELLGIITEEDFLKVSGQLNYRYFNTRLKPVQEL